MQDFLDIFPDKYQGLGLLTEWQNTIDDIIFSISHNIHLTSTQISVLKAIEEYDFIFIKD